MPGTIKIAAIGDINEDILMVPLPYESDSDKADNKVRQNCLKFSRDGGALLLEETIENALKIIQKSYDENSEQTKPQVIGYKSHLSKNNLKKLKKNKALAILKLFSRSDSAKDSDQVYRLEKLFGWLADSSQETELKRAFLRRQLLLEYTKKVLHSDTNNLPDFIILNDKSDQFRTLSLRDWFPCDHDQANQTTFILEMDKPLCKGKLWEDLIDNYPQQTIVIVSASALRQAGINIHETGSVEHLAQDLMAHCNENNEDLVAKLLKCQHLILNFDNNGVLHYENSIKNGKCNLSINYCPHYLHKEYLDKKQFGTMAGYTTILTTSIILSLIRPHKDDELLYYRLEDGIRLAVVLSKKYFENGYAKINFQRDTDETIYNPYPFKLLFQTHLVESNPDKKTPLVSVKLPADYKELTKWNRIKGLSKDLTENNENGFNDILVEIVENGLEIALQKNTQDEHLDSIFPNATLCCPIAKFGNLEIVDRKEIDSLIDIRQLISNYLLDEKWKKPLSFAVFGPPGSGKSFTVKEILKSIRDYKDDNVLEFNIAQFTDIADLTGAFHQAQDKAIFGGVPLVFFDEFDASFIKEKCGWLKYFLAPMQDGQFKGREGSYKIGRAIFIFAGGTSFTFEEFYNQEGEDDKSFKDSKGPDFVSRLRGYLNIKGINSRDPRSDNSLRFRRAVILRSILVNKVPQIINPSTKKANVGKELIKAFINVSCYEHGVRSMEAIIQMSHIGNEGFQIASLPTPAQLKMHVNTKSFLQDIPH